MLDLVDILKCDDHRKRLWICPECGYPLKWSNIFETWLCPECEFILDRHEEINE